MQPAIPAESEKEQMALMATHQWPQECLSLAERFPDFPLREDFSAQPADAPRWKPQTRPSTR
jgi:hypothetical protein